MRRLYRSRRERVFAGVAGGMAEYFQVDPTLMRIAWVAIGLGGFGVILYIISMIVIPERAYNETVEGGPSSPAEPGQTLLPDEPVEPPQVKSQDNSRTFGYVLVLVGIAFLFRRVVPWFSMGHLWPVVLIMIGAYLVSTNRSGR